LRIAGTKESLSSMVRTPEPFAAALSGAYFISKRDSSRDWQVNHEIIP
jgi:hypothetical protein